MTRKRFKKMCMSFDISRNKSEELCEYIKNTKGKLNYKHIFDECYPYFFPHMPKHLVGYRNGFIVHATIFEETHGRDKIRIEPDPRFCKFR